MNEMISTKAAVPLLFRDCLTKAVANFDSRSMLIAGGMLCATVVACVGFVSLSGGEMRLTLSGLTVSQTGTLD